MPLLVRLVARGSSSPSDIKRDDAVQVWHYARPLALGNMAMWGLRLSDRYIIGLFRPMTEVGLYSVAYTISDKSIDLLVALFLLTRGPMLMNIWEAQGRRRQSASRRWSPDCSSSSACRPRPGHRAGLPFVAPADRRSLPRASGWWEQWRLPASAGASRSSPAPA